MALNSGLKIISKHHPSRGWAEGHPRNGWNRVRRTRFENFQPLSSAH